MEELLKQIIAEQRKTNELLEKFMKKGQEADVASKEMRNKMFAEMGKQNPMVAAMMKNMGM